MEVDAVLGACAGLMLSALLVVSRDDCARWVLTRLDGAQDWTDWTPPLSGAVTGTGIFFAAASLWLLGNLLHI
ncbi:MAG: hypothetical protein ACRERC_01265 [Candidatus Binatia bacterium]